MFPNEFSSTAKNERQQASHFKKRPHTHRARKIPSIIIIPHLAKVCQVRTKIIARLQFFYEFLAQGKRLVCFLTVKKASAFKPLKSTVLQRSEKSLYKFQKCDTMK